MPQPPIDFSGSFKNGQEPQTGNILWTNKFSTLIGSFYQINTPGIKASLENILINDFHVLPQFRRSREKHAQNSWQNAEADLQAKGVHWLHISIVPKPDVSRDQVVGFWNAVGFARNRKKICSCQSCNFSTENLLAKSMRP